VRRLKLDTEGIHVWRFDLRSRPGQWALLDTAERTRALRISDARRGCRFVAGRATLRRILARYVALGPAEIEIEYNEYGKPRLARESDVEFNLSHAGNCALLAVACGTALGVDLEETRQDRRHEAIIKRFFSARERDEILSLPPDRRARGFYRAWVAREARAKALGCGVLTPHEESPDLYFRVASFELEGRFAAAIHWHGNERRLVWQSLVTTDERSSLGPRR
jgi:4'-phosphopantetheinyl transferase